MGRRRKLRTNSTDAEAVFWYYVRNRKLNGLKFKRQHSICNYIVDFYCAAKQLVIEIDGDIHYTEAQNKKDGLRDEHLASMNFKVLRFTNEQVLKNISYVKEKILTS